MIYFLKGLVTPVKNQKSCGSCAAFTASAVHETCMIMAGAPGKNLDLSEQQLVDCAYDNDQALGCQGAMLDAYPNWIVNENNGQVNHENNYPYLNSHPNLQCQNKPHWRAGARVTWTKMYFDISTDYSIDPKNLVSISVGNFFRRETFPTDFYSKAFPKKISPF